MAGSVRLQRWVFALLVVGALVVLADVLLTWRLLPFSPPTSATTFASRDSVNVNGLLRSTATSGAGRSAEQTTTGPKRLTELERNLETKWLYSLLTLSRQTSVQRGIVIPLYGKIMTLGVSLILQLRSLGVELPIEVPHCGDFDQQYGEILMTKREYLGELYVYNVCERAAAAKSVLDPSKPLFCADLKGCYAHFRGFYVKVLGVLFSRFEEVMLLDADALLFQSLMPLWDTKKFQTTGTLFFNDRIAEPHFNIGLAYRPANRPNIMAIEDYLSKMNVELFRHIPTLARPKAPADLIAADKSNVTLHFQPSENLLRSHFWHGRSAHSVDSSVLLWNKKRQPRATAFLASFVSLNDVPHPPSYGDKEFFFVACELAESQYAYSDFATGAAGSDFRDRGPNKSVVCGYASHTFPEISENASVQTSSLLYMNTDGMMRYKPKISPMYYTAPRAHDFYPGSFEDRKLLRSCPFDITGVKFSDAEVQQVYQRQRFFRIAKEWEDNANKSDIVERVAADALTNEELDAVMNLESKGRLIEDVVDFLESDLDKGGQDEKARKLKSKVDEVREQETQLIYTLDQIAQQTSVTRGIVIPVYDGNIESAVSLVLELRGIGLIDPIEMPYCGDLNADTQQLYLAKNQLGTVWFYDVCKKAAETTSIVDPSRRVFCEKVEDCYAKFRQLLIKPLAVTFSKFEEIMMVDADTTFFVSPAKLWDSDKYNKTGIFLMHDRMSDEKSFMAERVPGKPNVSVEQDYFSRFDIKLFGSLSTIERPKATSKNPSSLALKFEPSEFLLSSHSFNLRAGHQVDSSLVLWNKKRQARATAILASFIALNDIAAPPSSGDKEYFFYASELAETQYAFSDHAVSAVGTERTDGGAKNSTLCGDMAQVFPIHQDGVPDKKVPLFYLHSDHILLHTPELEPVYYIKAQPWDLYPGPFGKREQVCSSDITIGKLSGEEKRQLAKRQRFYEEVDAWNRVAHQKPDNLDEPNAAIVKLLRTSIVGEERQDPVDAAHSSPYTDQTASTTQMMEKQLVYTLSQITQRTTTKRGIVMPLYEPISRMGFSLILELRSMGISLPVEVPYCNDLESKTVELIGSKKELGEIRAYDVCSLAAEAKSVMNATRPVFCADIDKCRTKFQSFMIKPLAVIYSQFEQIMLLDADTTFFIDPTLLFESEKFKATGTFFMHDRIGSDWKHMAKRVAGNRNISVEQKYFSEFDVTPFQALPTIQRPKATVENKTPVKLKFEPSDILLKSHSFNRRAGHELESSMLILDKKRQPRATVILASFVAQNDIASPPSYGDKELFFYASELAETQYSVSDYATGAVGTKLWYHGPKKSVLCGDMAHLFPIHQDGVQDDDVPLFYLNSDRILLYKPDVEPVYYMKARPWAYYPGSFRRRPQRCPFNITVGRFEESHVNRLAERLKVF
ncbi:unnamed protein product [Hyaloperonospora brassicae]|uniref:Nucleotide-diphospho-sugar transferase n=1 Tax=Hyaloperonospora brassicae TaxID=162125 RepID=A0AAV0UYR6_HYABA|nr:unnamed protein product [Hyaloperonospora brassicae]